MKKNHLILFLIVFVSIFSIFSFSEKVEASMEDKMFGTAWSSNIGWISFNNCEIIKEGEQICSEIPYGVSYKDDSGELYGYAWSSNIGWIQFGELEGFPEQQGTTPSNAMIDLETGKLTGWARALSFDQNSEIGGWISLDMKGVVNYGTSFDFTTGRVKSTSFAWGSEVIGWVSFDNVTILPIPPPKDPVVWLSSNKNKIIDGEQVRIYWSGNNLITDEKGCIVESDIGAPDWDGTKNSPAGNVFTNLPYTQNDGNPQEYIFGLYCAGIEEDPNSPGNLKLSPTAYTTVSVYSRDTCMDPTATNYLSEGICTYLPPTLDLTPYCLDATSTKGFVVFNSTNLPAGSPCVAGGFQGSGDPTPLLWSTAPDAGPVVKSVSSGQFNLTCTSTKDNSVVSADVEVLCPSEVIPLCVDHPQECPPTKKIPKYIER